MVNVRVLNNPTNTCFWINKLFWKTRLLNFVYYFLVCSTEYTSPASEHGPSSDSGHSSPNSCSPQGSSPTNTGSSQTSPVHSKAGSPGRKKTSWETPHHLPNPPTPIPSKFPTPQVPNPHPQLYVWFTQGSFTLILKNNNKTTLI